jgi:hypothetical protein
LCLRVCTFSKNKSGNGALISSGQINKLVCLRVLGKYLSFCLGATGR